MNDAPMVKAPYVTPRLVVYGDLQSITQTRAAMGNDLGASPRNFSM